MLAKIGWYRGRMAFRPFVDGGLLFPRPMESQSFSHINQEVKQMKAALEAIREKARKELSEIADTKALDALRVQYPGQKAS